MQTACDIIAPRLSLHDSGTVRSIPIPIPIPIRIRIFVPRIRIRISPLVRQLDRCLLIQLGQHVSETNKPVYLYTHVHVDKRPAACGSSTCKPPQIHVNAYELVSQLMYMCIIMHSDRIGSIRSGCVHLFVSPFTMHAHLSFTSRS